MSLIVNSEEITDSEVEQEHKRLLGLYEQKKNQLQNDFNVEDLKSWAKENCIERVLFRQEALKKKGSISEEKIKEEFEKIKASHPDAPDDKITNDIELKLLSEELQKEILGSVEEITDKEVEEYYTSHTKEFKRPEMVHAAHIVKHIQRPQDEEPARFAIEEIQKQLQAGKTFEECASETSDCPDQAGDLGFFPRGEMVQEFEDVVFSMQEGEVSDIVQTQFGFHIIKLHKKIPEGMYPMEEVSKPLKERLFAQKREKAMETFLDLLREKADIQNN
jgi:parvulin-like peptidyl-prolyl isomerase